MTTGQGKAAAAAVAVAAQERSMIVHVEKKMPFQKPVMEAIVIYERNKLHELEFALQMTDAAWMTKDGKWSLVPADTYVVELSRILNGNGITQETPFRCYERVGGVFIDSWNGFSWGLSKMASFVTYPFYRRRQGYQAADAEEKPKDEHVKQEPAKAKDEGKPMATKDQLNKLYTVEEFE